MLQSEFYSALNQVASERGISLEAVIETIEVALASAYKKEFDDPSEEIEGKIDPDSGETKIFKEGKDVTPPGFGRIAAQTAKQVILQKINEAEKDAVQEEFSQQLGKLISGIVFRFERGVVVIDLQRTHGILEPKDQIPGERYFRGNRMKFVVKEVREGLKKSEVLLTRTSPEFIKELFASEVPEIAAGSVVIEAIAREAGLRTKMAVSTKDDKLDPVGSCVGQKGVRVQAVMDELGAERIDIVPYNSETKSFIANALSPAIINKVEIDEKGKQAHITVDEDQLSLVIGKGGQNVRLAAKLTGWSINVNGEKAKDLEKTSKEALESDDGGVLKELNVSSKIKNNLKAGGVTSLEQIKEMNDKELEGIKGIGKKAVEEIRESIT